MPDFHSSLKETPIFKKTYELYQLFYQYLILFPKGSRYSLGQKCETVLLEILEAVILASSVPKQEKLPILRKASMKIDVLRILFTLCKDLKIIDNKKYTVLENMTIEIGKMIGGWIKTTTL